MALASKVNIYPLAILLPGAFVIRYLTVDRSLSKGNHYWTLVIACLIVGGVATIISFRIFQPYAFDGLMPEQQWIANIPRNSAPGNG